MEDGEGVTASAEVTTTSLIAAGGKLDDARTTAEFGDVERTFEDVMSILFDDDVDDDDDDDDFETEEVTVVTAAVTDGL